MGRCVSQQTAGLEGDQPKTLLWKRGVDAYQYMCLEYGLEAEDFRCTDGNSHVCRSVFDLIAAKLGGMCIDCLVVEKPKTDPALREEKRFYPEMLGYLLKFVLPKELAAAAEEVIVITDTLPVNKKRRAVEKSARLVLAKLLSRRMKYRILHQASRSHHGLQVADYCCWAVFRKWQREEIDHYDRTKQIVRSEFDIFQTIKRQYY